VDIEVPGSNLTATVNHMPHEITRCYLPPGSGDFPAFTPAEASTRFSDLEGCKAELTWWWLYPKIVYPPKTVAYLEITEQLCHVQEWNPRSKVVKSSVLTTKPACHLLSPDYFLAVKGYTPLDELVANMLLSNTSCDRRKQLLITA